MFDHFFGRNSQMDSVRLLLNTVELQKGEACYFLGGRNSLVKQLREAGTQHVKTADGSCLSIAFKANIRRLGEYAKTAAKEVKTAVAMPVAAVGGAVAMYRQVGDTDFGANAKMAVEASVNALDMMQVKQEYHRKTCIIVQVFNSDTNGAAPPANPNTMITGDVTFATLATLLDHLLPQA